MAGERVCRHAPPPEPVQWRAKLAKWNGAGAWMVRVRGEPVVEQTWYAARERWAALLGVQHDEIEVEVIR